MIKLLPGAAARAFSRRVSGRRRRMRHRLIRAMKQHVRVKLVQRRQELGCSAHMPAAKGYTADHYRPRLAAIYSEHEELFRRLEHA